MQQISTLFGQVVTRPETIKRTSERNELVGEILDLVNSERKAPYKPFKPSYIAYKLSHIPTQDLYYIISTGKDYKNRRGSFSKYLFGSLKVKPVDNSCKQNVSDL